MPSVLRLAAVAIVVLVGTIVTACGSSVPSVDASQLPESPGASVAVGGALVSVETTGGECPQGACDRTIVIDGDGRIHQVAPGPAELGSVPAATLDALVAEIEQTDFEDIRSHRFTDTCPIAFDGQETIYVFTVGTSTERIDSCESVVDPNHPLFAAVDGVLAAVPR